MWERDLLIFERYTSYVKNTCVIWEIIHNTWTIDNIHEQDKTDTSDLDPLFIVCTFVHYGGV